MRKIIILAVVPVLIAVSIGLYMYNKGPEDIEAARAIPVLSTNLYETYATDSVGANLQFTGKILEVTGLLQSVNRNNAGETIAMLNTGRDGAYINCTFEQKNVNLLAGTEVSIKGICTGIQSEPDLGILGDVYLIRCFESKK